MTLKQVRRTMSAVCPADREWPRNSAILLTTSSGCCKHNQDSLNNRHVQNMYFKHLEHTNHEEMISQTTKTDAFKMKMILNTERPNTPNQLISHLHQYIILLLLSKV